MSHGIYDFAGVGIGPFNLSLACLCEPLEDVRGIFFDRTERFDWHPGLMLPNARMQTPFPADLVTLADPTSRFSFLNFLKVHGRIRSFCMRNDNFILRREFNHYCQWCAAQLPNLHFGHHVVTIEHDRQDDCFRIQTRDTTTSQTGEWRARRLVIGAGTRPAWPPGIPRDHPRIIHAAEYCAHRENLLTHDDITVIGGGQSGAEIFLDILDTFTDSDHRLTWITRAPHFFPTEEAKFSLELSTPEYTDYFYALPPEEKAGLLRESRNLYRGARLDTLDRIYDLLYARRVFGHRRTRLQPETILEEVVPERDHGSLRLVLRHGRSGAQLTQCSKAVVLATGYVLYVPDALASISRLLRRDEQGRFIANRNYAVDHAGDTVFVHNWDHHSHGFSAFDLGLVCHRNIRIINTITGSTRYRSEECGTFQQFGLPDWKSRS